MVFPLNYVLATITPAGRLPQFPFAMLCVALAFANLWLYREALHGRDGLGEMYMAALLVLIWMKFSILSRRMHDTGSNGLILVPLLFAAIGIFLCSYDPALVGEARGQAGRFGMLIEHGTKGVRILFVAIFLYLLRAPSDTGPNGYGPEWDDIAEASPKAPAKTVSRGEASREQAASTQADLASRGSTRAGRNALARLESLGSRPAPRIATPEPAPTPKPRARGFAAGTPSMADARAFSRRG